MRTQESHTDITSSEESALSAWFSEGKHRLRDDAEVIPGLDDRPLIHLSEAGRYVSVGRGLVAVLPLFDGDRTGDDVLRELQAGPEGRAKLAVAMNELRQAGALRQAPAQETGRQGIARFMRKEHLLRFPLTRSIGRYLEPLVAPVRRVPGAALAWAWTAFSALGLVIGVWALAAAGSGWSMPAHLWVLYPLIFVQIAFHELSHALVCQYLKVPVREAGIGLMLYVMPVGYVDRTDSYRITRRWPRAFLSLAGPINDQIWFGVTGLVALLAHGEVAHLAFMLLIFQAFLTLMNFNPLVPSDGYHAVSALSGVVNLRGQALGYLTHRVLRLPLTTAQQQASAGRKRFYRLYAMGCLVFVAVLAWGMLRSIAGIVGLFS